MKRIKNNILLAAAVTILMSLGSLTSANEENKTNNVAERMIFEVRWAFVTAGEAVLEFIPGEQLDGESVNHYIYRAQTSSFVDLFYKVRDTIESYTDTDLNRSIEYIKKQRGKSVRDITVTFDWNKNTAQYSLNGNSMAPLEISPGTFDPLSVFYVFRTKLSDDNKEMKIRLTDGKRYINAVASIIKKEKIEVAGTTYDTVLVEPEMEGVGGVFQKTKNAKLKIWVTDDDRRIPVRIKSKVAVGSFVADLVGYEGTYTVGPR